MARRDASARRPLAPHAPAGLLDDDDLELARWLGERLRRLALGLTAALITARVYWTGEAVTELDTGDGLTWVLALLGVVGIALAGFVIGGATRIRWSWADAAVYVLMLLVGLSACWGAERRVAINLAWEWGGLGLAYALLRSLPRTRQESSTLAGALVAAAVAVSAYGLYQAAVEFPRMHAEYQRNPAAVLQRAGVDPSSPARKNFEDRLLGSNEPFSTFALTNSLAGFLVGPAVVVLAIGLEGLRGRNGGRWASIAAAALPGLILLGCLLLTKSRSAYVGLLAAAALLAWRERRRVPGRVLALAGGVLALVLALLIAAAAATRHLDVQVLTQSTRSLRYRWEYWIGTWHALRGEPGAFWHGFGPGNFAGPYLRHKLPWASEEIRDPHNLVLDVWTTAGLWAVVALLAALGLGLGNTLARPGRQEEPDLDATAPGSRASRSDPDAPPQGTGWLLIWAAGGWLAVVLLGKLNPFQEELLARWLVLGAGWALAVGLGCGLWRRVRVPPFALGAGALAVVVNLLAAGGIGVPTVAIGLWTLLALGLNLREEAACGRLRLLGGRMPAFGLMVVWAALVGTFGLPWLDAVLHAQSGKPVHTFAGAIGPFWESQSAMATAEEALRVRPPNVQAAREAYVRACQLDQYSVTPWLALASLEYQEWLAKGAPADVPFWTLIDDTLNRAVRPPRNPNSMDVQKHRALILRAILDRRAGSMPAKDVIRLRAHLVAAYRIMTRLYPTSAILRAELAESSAEIGDYAGAAQAAERALRLDKLMPHADKKLPEAVRQHLAESLSKWLHPEPPPTAKQLQSRAVGEPSQSKRTAKQPE